MNVSFLDPTDAGGRSHTSNVGRSRPVPPPGHALERWRCIRIHVLRFAAFVLIALFAGQAHAFGKETVQFRLEEPISPEMTKLVERMTTIRERCQSPSTLGFVAR